MKKLTCFFFCIVFFSSVLLAQQQVQSRSSAAFDPNFYIYLCFGQSNMEGNAAIAADDRIGVSDRFKVMTVSADDFSHLSRTAGSWYTAIPPLCRWDTGLTPADYFGRTMLDSLPSNVKIGVIVIAMGGSGIDAFDKDNYTQYYNNADAWQKSLMNIYGGSPYAKMVQMAKLAQQSGVIKGILLHQGETNNGQTDWPLKVKKIYNNLLTDLSLAPNSIPLLAGEMLQQDQGGICWGMNSVIATLPNVIPNSFVISSKGCTGNGVDGFHFSTVGARELGKRYGLKMIPLAKTYTTVAGQTVDRLAIENTSFTLQTGLQKKVPLTAVFADGHVLDVSFRATYTISNPDVARITDGVIETLKDGATSITASYKGDLGNTQQVTFTVTSTTFPLTNALFNADIWTDGTFDESTHSLKTGQWGFGGWQYSGVNLSEYKYIVARLGSDNTAGVEFKLFDANNYWGAPAAYKFGTTRQVIVPLQTALKTDGAKLDPSHIYIAGFWSTGAASFVIDRVFLAKTDQELTALKDILSTDENEKMDVYSIAGVLLRTQIERKRALDGLSEGVYILGNRNGMIKIFKTEQSKSF